MEVFGILTIGWRVPLRALRTPSEKNGAILVTLKLNKGRFRF